MSAGAAQGRPSSTWFSATAKAALRGDFADAIEWLKVIEVVDGVLPAGWQATRDLWLRGETAADGGPDPAGARARGGQRQGRGREVSWAMSARHDWGQRRGPILDAIDPRSSCAGADPHNTPGQACRSRRQAIRSLNPESAREHEVPAHADSVRQRRTAVRSKHDGETGWWSLGVRASAEPTRCEAKPTPARPGPLAGAYARASS